MAIVKRNSKSKGVRWQVKVRDGAGEYFPSNTFKDYREAKKYESVLNMRKLEGEVAKESADNITVGEFFETWIQGVIKISDGWRRDRIRDFKTYVFPFMGNMKMNQVRPIDVAEILKNMHNLNKAPQTQLHIFNLLRKLFNDAIEDYQILNLSPVLRKLKPLLQRKERPYLDPEESTKLLQYVRGKPFEIAVWINLVMGNRVGEIMSLMWRDIDFDKGEICVRSTYCRKEKRIKDYPKGGKQYRLTLQSEVVEKLRLAFQNRASDYVCPGPGGQMMSYHSYYVVLRRYCMEAGVTIVATHGLRHSTSAIWKAAGATDGDIQKLFNHSSASVTERYIHGTDERLTHVARKMRLIKANDLGLSVPIIAPEVK